MALQCTPENIQQMMLALKASFGLVENDRKQATAFLQAQQQQPGFCQILLAVISQAGQSAPDIASSASISLKNLCKKHWTNDDSTDFVVCDGDKQFLKSSMLAGMSVCSPQVCASLSEAVMYIAKSDFPQRWPNLLPELFAQLQSSTSSARSEILLSSLHMVFKRYRHEERSDEMWADLKLVLSQSVQPMLTLTHMLTTQLPQLQPNKLAVTGHIKCITLLIKIFHSMCAQDFAAQIEESMRSWMELIHTLLTMEWLVPMYAQDNDDEDLNELLHMRKACMGTLNLFASHYQEEFAAFMPPLVKVVWDLANAAPGGGFADEYVSSLMKFLSIIARSRDHAVVDGDQVMPAIVRAVVVPNVIMRASDVERFDEDGAEYMQRDLLGADIHTRRKAAADLLKAFNSHQERSACALGMESIQTLTQRASAGAPDAVQLKEAAISIMIAIGITSSSEVTGAVTVSPHVDSLAFFQQAIMPELQPAAASSPILVAAALKFIVAFRHTLGTMNLPAVLGLITPHLSNPHYVVHTYAAFAITRMLDTKVPKAAGGVPEPLINSATFAPFFGATVGGLFSVLSLPASKENEHAMRCLMRVVIVTGAAALPHAAELVQRLNAIVVEILKQCRNPLFPYYVFETLAAFLRFVCGNDAALIAAFTQAFMPQYSLIKSEANAEAMLPYAWQIFSMLVQRTPAPLPPYLVAEFPLFFSPDLWSNRSNVPAMVRVLCSFVSQDAGQLLQGEGMTKLLGLTQQLVSKKSSDDQGMLLLCAIFNAVPFAQLQQYAQGIFHMMLGRLQTDKTVKYNRLFLNAFGLACMKFTPQAVAAVLNSMQANLFVTICSSVVASNIKELVSNIDKKMFVVGFSSALSSPPLVEHPAVWAKLVHEIVCLMAPAQGQALKAGAQADFQLPSVDTPDDIVAGVDNSPGCASAFSPLHNAGKLVTDYAAAVPSFPQHFAQKIGALFAPSNGGQFTHALQAHLEQDKALKVAQFFASHGIPL